MDVINMQNIVKNFEGVQALKGVDFSLKKGEVHVLLGENGAGKSTLINIIAGIHKQTAGEMFLNDKSASFSSPKDAEKIGIGVIHQEQSLLLDKDVAANIFLAREPKRNGFIDYKTMHKEAEKYLEKLDVDIDSHTMVRNLGAARRQMVEIAKALSREPDVLIMDEPTASLSTGEVEILFKVISRMQNQGISIIYISHRMEEIFQIASRVTILRDGLIVDSAPIEEMTMPRIVTGIVGRNIDATNFREKSDIGETALLVDKLSGDRFNKCTIAVRKGEVVGLAGLVGAGRTELVETVYGIRPKTEGEVYVSGKRFKPDPGNAIKMKMGFLPEDRKKDGLILDKSIRENIALPSRRFLHRFGIINKRVEKKLANDYINSLKIATTSSEKLTVELSGGTQQKVVIARWLCSDSKVLIFDEPTRGVDVGSREEIYNLINDLTKHGAAVLLVSSDMMELLGITDRIYTMYKGSITAELETNGLSNEDLFSKCASKGEKKIG